MKHSIIATIVLFIILIGAFIYGGRLTSVTNDLKEKAMLEEIRKQEEKEAQALAFRQRLKAKADSAYAFAQENDLDLKHAFLVDFSLHSGKDRFFVWDFEGDTVAFASLWSHRNRSCHGARYLP